MSFAIDCLRLDPSQRPTCDELMNHEYFNEFREWFEDEIQTLIEYDIQEQNPKNVSTLQRAMIVQPNTNQLSR